VRPTASRLKEQGEDGEGKRRSCAIDNQGGVELDFPTKGENKFTTRFRKMGVERLILFLECPVQVKDRERKGEN